MTTLQKVLGIALLLVTPTAVAAENGYVIRAADLMDQPFIDATKTGSVTANEAVEIVQRQGAWVRIAVGGKTGWVRMLNMRMGAATLPNSKGKTNTSFLTTGSSGSTVTTGVKGLDEENIRNAVPDAAELDTLNSLGATADDAKALAASDKLTENQVDYLKKGKVK